MEIEIPNNIPVEGEIDAEQQGLSFIHTGDQYLTFILGREHYAIDILSVNEIRGWENPTLIPHSEEFVKGVINLRGVIVPIVDLRTRFGVGEVIYSATTVVIVLSVTSPKARTMGFVVDAVSDVLNAEESDIKKAPMFSANISQDFVNGLVNVGNDVVTILNVHQLMNLDA